MDKIQLFKNEWDELKIAVESGDAPWALHLMNHIEMLHFQSRNEDDYE